MNLSTRAVLSKICVSFWRPPIIRIVGGVICLGSIATAQVHLIIGAPETRGWLHSASIAEVRSDGTVRIKEDLVTQAPGSETAKTNPDEGLWWIEVDYDHR